MSIDPLQIRVGDAQRSEALQQLSQHYADGMLNLTKFEERTSAAATARTRGDLDKLFLDLPSLDRAAEEPHPNTPATLSAEQELDNLLERGQKVRLADNIIGTLMILFFVLGLFVFHSGYFLVSFPVAVVASMIVRWIYRIDGDDEKLVKELKKTNTKEQIKRLKQAAKRRKELGH